MMAGVLSRVFGRFPAGHCDLLESELAELGVERVELRASREKISTLVVIWSGVTAELRAA